jgi:hypothetical protein
VNVRANQLRKRHKRIQLVIGGLFLLNYWLVSIEAIKEGKMFAYQNYWGAPQETFTLLFMVIIATPMYLILLWRHWR